MYWIVILARLLLGATFLFFGLNTILWSLYDAAIIEPPAEMPAAAAAFQKALTETGFMHPLRGFAEAVGGLFVLTGFLLPLGLLLLAPVIVHIVLYHHYVDPQGAVIGYVLAGLALLVAYAYGSAFQGVLAPFARSRWRRAPRSTK